MRLAADKEVPRYDASGFVDRGRSASQMEGSPMNRDLRGSAVGLGALFFVVTLQAQEPPASPSGQPRPTSIPTDSVQQGESTDNAASQRQRRARRLRPKRTTVTLLDQEVSITYGALAVGGQDYRNFDEIEEGIVAFIESYATKLLTDADLYFGDTVIKAHNHGETYPGVYSLWLKNSAAGWSLVFNHEADVWGTMHNPGADAAEVPMQLRTATEPTEELEFELTDEDGAVGIRVTWGTREWTLTAALTG